MVTSTVPHGLGGLRPSDAALPLAAFKKLYVEEEVRGREVAAILDARQTRSRPVYDELLSWARVHQSHEPPSSTMGKAIQYLTNHALALTRFLDDGVVAIDNGPVERLHVRTALTRKNFLFAGSDAGGHRAAVAYTVLGCCDLADVNPVEYLADVLPKLSRRVRLADIPALVRGGASGVFGMPGMGVRLRPERVFAMGRSTHLSALNWARPVTAPTTAQATMTTSGSRMTSNE